MLQPVAPSCVWVNKPLRPLVLKAGIPETTCWCVFFCKIYHSKSINNVINQRHFPDGLILIYLCKERAKSIRAGEQQSDRN
uniref:Ovule protein n=1 Tax=Steinernema glaseri TaxID=37863 RepID=A0A1I8A6Q1_9BILA